LETNTGLGLPQKRCFRLNLPSPFRIVFRSIRFIVLSFIHRQPISIDRRRSNMYFRIRFLLYRE